MGRLASILYQLAIAAVAVKAQAAAYGQCGGQGWTGATTCVSGYVCTYSNPYYSQCVPGTGSGTTTVGTTTTRPTTTTSTSVPATTGSYNQPIFWEDLADLEVIRVGDTFYYTASTMHYSPGAPILRSYDLVNWEYAGHAVPVLDWNSKYDLTTSRAYVKGIWASSLRYRKSNGLYYWVGCIEFSQSWVYTSSSVAGPWTRHGPISTCFYDAGLLIDDNDTMYVAYGNTNINVAQLSSDGFSVVKTQQVFTSPSNVGTIEGSRMYKINGKYYILVTQPTPGGEWALQSTSGTPWGPYNIKALGTNSGSSPVSGAAGVHQGGLVDLADGRYYYIGFVDAYPGGRIPTMAPVTFGSDGFPTVNQVNGAFGTSYPLPLSTRPLKSQFGTFTFSSPLSAEWEWNHNPDTTKFSFPGSGALKLSTATVTTDLYSARNTITRRIPGPQSTATIVLDYSAMANGDRAGLVLLRDQSAWIGIKKDSGAARLVMVSGITMSTTDWSTTATGSEAGVGGSIPATGKIWLRIQADIRPSSSSPQGLFSYSTDGNTFTRVGPAFVMYKDWHFFLGYRFGVFNYATSALGGSVLVNSFAISQ